MSARKERRLKLHRTLEMDARAKLAEVKYLLETVIAPTVGYSYITSAELNWNDMMVKRALDLVDEVLETNRAAKSEHKAGGDGTCP